MKKQWKIVVSVLACVICLTACGSGSTDNDTVQSPQRTAAIDPAIIGTWEEADVPEGQKLKDYWTFNSDGTGVYGLMDVEINYTASGGTLHFSCDFGEYTYTYTFDGNILTLTEEGSSPHQYQKTN